MNEFKYPGKILAYFRGDITQMPEYVKLYNNSLAVLKVKVTTPKGILLPILPHKVNGTTIYPEGSWTGWYYKDELENALKYGYKYQILEGYLFESTTIFTDFVNTLYKIKETSNPKSPEYTNVKLILNSVFGRFGMKPFQISHIVVNKHYVAGKIEDIGLDNVISTLEYNNKTIISFNPKFPNVPMVNVAIASAITANARVYMSEFKNNPEYILYYTDTDSYFVNKPLPSHLVDSKKLGFFKLEKVLTKFIAIGPKVYGGRLVDGTEFVKAKGLKTSVTLEQLQGLLVESESKVFKQEKSFNSLKEGFIKQEDRDYTLRPTSIKINLVYKNGILVATTNKVIEE